MFVDGGGPEVGSLLEFARLQFAEPRLVGVRLLQGCFGLLGRGCTVGLAVLERRLVVLETLGVIVEAVGVAIEAVVVAVEACLESGDPLVLPPEFGLESLDAVGEGGELGLENIGLGYSLSETVSGMNLRRMSLLLVFAGPPDDCPGADL